MRRWSAQRSARASCSAALARLYWAQSSSASASVLRQAVTFFTIDGVFAPQLTSAMMTSTPGGNSKGSACRFEYGCVRVRMSQRGLSPEAARA